MKMDAWRAEKYDEVFAATTTSLERRRRIDARFTVADAEGQLKHLYIQEGNDQLGRGDLQDIILSATIAAFEGFVAEWKAASPQERLPAGEPTLKE
jgi:hypothetical protein